MPELRARDPGARAPGPNLAWQVPARMPPHVNPRSGLDCRFDVNQPVGPVDLAHVFETDVRALLFDCDPVRPDGQRLMPGPMLDRTLQEALRLGAGAAARDRSARPPGAGPASRRAGRRRALRHGVRRRRLRDAAHPRPGVHGAGPAAGGARASSPARTRTARPAAPAASTTIPTSGSGRSSSASRRWPGSRRSCSTPGLRSRRGGRRERGGGSDACVRGGSSGGFDGNCR